MFASLGRWFSILLVIRMECAVVKSKYTKKWWWYSEIRYYDRIASIHLKKWGKYAKLYTAAKLVKLAIRICPDFFKEYDRLTIQKYLQDWGFE